MDFFALAEIGSTRQLFPSPSSCGSVPARPKSSALDSLPRRTRASAATRPPLAGCTGHNQPRRPAPTQEGRRRRSYACGSIPARPHAASRSSVPPHEAARELVPTPSCELVRKLLSLAGTTCGAPLLRRRTNREAEQAWAREGAGRICSPPRRHHARLPRRRVGRPGASLWRKTRRAGFALTVARVHSEQTAASGERPPLGGRGRKQQGDRRGKELTCGPIFASANKSIYVQRCVGGKEIKSQCTPH
jgi:hypothetical protein